MTLSISVKQHIKAFPRRTVLTLACDAVECQRVQRFEHRDGYIGAHALAMKAGWLERHDAKDRQWLCPFCSGK